MKKLLVASAVMACFASDSVAAEKAEPKTQKEKAGYSIGVSLGESLKKQGIELDIQMVIQGMKDSYSGSKLLMADKDIQTTLQSLQKDMAAKQNEQAVKEGLKNKKEGEAFLAANKKKEGVNTLPSGLQYKIIKEGSGKPPKKSDTVNVNYKGTLINGTEFDSSYKRGTPASFPVGGVIPGWTEALQLMKPGSKWQLFIPSNLAYGERGAGPMIGPNSTLIFEVELISIK